MKSIIVSKLFTHAIIAIEIVNYQWGHQIMFNNPKGNCREGRIVCFPCISMQTVASFKDFS